MGLPNRVTDKNRQSIRAAFAGGSAALRFWAFQGTVGSADGDAADNQYAAAWNFGVVRVALYCLNDPGATIVGIHRNRNLVAEVTQTVTAAGADVVTLFGTLGKTLFSLGQELSISVDPANDPGASYLSIAIENDSP